MKSHIRVLAIITALVMLQGIFTRPAAAQPSGVSFQVFYDQLSPYGQWINHPNYGYVWIPDAGPDFAPYSSNGYWVLTDYGWTWSSDYEWGWAPFHYGRWDFDNYYGWFWIPDNEWGPAWVTWRRAEGYYGWEPMGPGITIGMSFGNNYNNYNHHWTFVNDRYFGRNDLNRYYVNQNDHERIFRNSTIINNTYNDNRRQIKYVSGPERTEVRKVTGRNISPVTFQENSVPGQKVQNGVFRTYRPDVKSNKGDQKPPAPARVTNVQDVRKPSERNSSGLQTKNPGLQQQNSTKQQPPSERQNTVNKQNETNQQNAVKQQNAINQQNALDRQKEAQKQFTIKQQEAVKRQNEITRQNAEKQQNNTRQQQDVVKQQNNTKQQQEVVKQQNSTRQQQDVVKQQNNTKQQEDVVKQQNSTRQQQEVVKQQNNTKQQEDVVKQQNSTRQQQEVVKQQNSTRQQKDVVKPQNNTKQHNVTKQTDVKTNTTTKKEEH